jgi:hypothetical protein
MSEIKALFGIATEVALNKTIISLAIAQNRQLMGTQRNQKVPTTDLMT